MIRNELSESNGGFWCTVAGFATGGALFIGIGAYVHPLHGFLGAGIALEGLAIGAAILKLRHVWKKHQEEQFNKKEWLPDNIPRNDCGITPGGTLRNATSASGGKGLDFGKTGHGSATNLVNKAPVRVTLDEHNSIGSEQYCPNEKL